MNDQQIQEEAKRRLASMTEQEKEAIWGFSEADNEFLRYVEQKGRKNLNPQEVKKFRQLLADHAAKAVPGGMIQSSLVDNLQEQFSISKDDLRKGGVKNPYKAKMFRDIIVAVVLNIAAAALAVGGLAPGAIAVEASTGVIAMDFARHVKAYFNFKKIQKKYMSGEMDEEEIKAVMLQELLGERDKRWNR